MVVDELVVTLGLDPKNFNDGQKKALEDFKTTVDGFQRQGRAAEDSAKSLTDFLSSARTQALSLFAVFTGAKGLVDFTENTIRSTAAVGRLSHSTGVSIGEITKLQGLVRTFGGDAGQASSEIVTLSDAMSGLKLGQVSPLITLLRAIQNNGGVPIDNEHGPAAMLASIAENLKNIHDRFGADVAGNLGRQLGLDPALFEAMIGGAARFNEQLAQIKGLTEADAKAALELQQRWDGLKVSTENVSKQMLFSAIDGISSYFHDMGRVITIISGGKDPGPSGSARPSGALVGPFSAGSASFSDRFPSNTGNPAYREAIAAIESKGSGGYGAVGPVTASGDRAYGRYQIMGNNIGPWSEAALGKRLSIQEFMASQSAQDAIFDHRFGQYVKQFGNPQDAASAWLTGKPLSEGAGRHDLFGTSGASYSQRFTENLRGIDRGGGGGNSTSSTFNINGPITVTPPAGADPDQFASAFAAALKRQALAAQANRGQN